MLAALALLAPAVLPPMLVEAAAAALLAIADVTLAVRALHHWSTPRLTAAALALATARVACRVLSAQLENVVVWCHDVEGTVGFFYRPWAASQSVISRYHPTGKANCAGLGQLLY